MRALGRAHGERVWPGFRPDTIPVAFVLPGRGTLLTGWQGAAPPGFSALDGGGLWRDEEATDAASTSTAFDGKATAQLVVADDASQADLVALAFHESFHVLQEALRRENRRFGQGENAFHVSTYPIFDVENEALFALEGQLLFAATGTQDAARRLALAREFVGVRRKRHTRLAPEMSTFDDASEMNEGLAQYAQLRALDLLQRHGPREWRASAARAVTRERSQLTDLTRDQRRSFRLRYYATGPAIASLLDALASPAWKADLMSQNSTLAGALGRVVGLDAPAEEAAARAVARVGAARLHREARATVGTLQARRQQQVDSVLSQPGVRVVVTLDSTGPDWGLCGFDPQNHLQVTPTVRLQTRWWKPCAGQAASAELAVPSVHDAAARSVSVVVGAEEGVNITADGRPLSISEGAIIAGVTAMRITAPQVTIEVSRADVSRTGRTLHIRVRL